LASKFFVLIAKIQARMQSDRTQYAYNVDKKECDLLKRNLGYRVVVVGKKYSQVQTLELPAETAETCGSFHMLSCNMCGC
jgi:hypothetical protein